MLLMFKNAKNKNAYAPPACTLGRSKYAKVNDAVDGNTWIVEEPIFCYTDCVCRRAEIRREREREPKIDYINEKIF